MTSKNTETKVNIRMIRMRIVRITRTVKIARTVRMTRIIRIMIATRTITTATQSPNILYLWQLQMIPIHETDIQEFHGESSKSLCCGEDPNSWLAGGPSIVQAVQLRNLEILELLLTASADAKLGRTWDLGGLSDLDWTYHMDLNGSHTCRGYVA